MSLEDSNYHCQTLPSVTSNISNSALALDCLNASTDNNKRSSPITSTTNACLRINPDLSEVAALATAAFGDGATFNNNTNVGFESLWRNEGFKSQSKDSNFEFHENSSKSSSPYCDLNSHNKKSHSFPKSSSRSANNGHPYTSESYVFAESTSVPFDRGNKTPFRLKSLTADVTKLAAFDTTSRHDKRNQQSRKKHNWEHIRDKLSSEYLSSDIRDDIETSMIAFLDTDSSPERKLEIRKPSALTAINEHAILFEHFLNKRMNPVDVFLHLEKNFTIDNFHLIERNRITPKKEREPSDLEKFHALVQNTVKMYKRVAIPTDQTFIGFSGKLVPILIEIPQQVVIRHSNDSSTSGNESIDCVEQLPQSYCRCAKSGDYVRAVILKFSALTKMALIRLLDFPVRDYSIPKSFIHYWLPFELCSEPAFVATCQLTDLLSSDSTNIYEDILSAENHSNDLKAIFLCNTNDSRKMNVQLFKGDSLQPLFAYDHAFLKLSENSQVSKKEQNQAINTNKTIQKLDGNPTTPSKILDYLPMSNIDDKRKTQQDNVELNFESCRQDDHILITNSRTGFEDPNNTYFDTLDESDPRKCTQALNSAATKTKQLYNGPQFHIYRTPMNIIHSDDETDLSGNR